MTKDLKVYCKEHGYDNPKFWPANYTNDHAVSLHMRSNDRWEEFDANVVFILGENGKNNAKLLDQILEELQEPVVLTIPLAVSASQQNFFKRLGLVLVPARWTNNLEEFEIYIKGQMNMGGFVNLMERVESIGYNLLAIRRPLPIIFFSFISFKLSQVLRKTTKLPCGNLQFLFSCKYAVTIQFTNPHDIASLHVIAMDALKCNACVLLGLFCNLVEGFVNISEGI